MRVWVAVFFVLMGALTGPLSAAADLIGNQPSFVSIEKCPAPAKDLIHELKMDESKIHACELHKEAIFQSKEKADVITLAYGDPDDCPAGCIYKNYAAVVDTSAEKVSFAEIIPKQVAMTLIFEQLPQYAVKARGRKFLCDQDLQSLVSESVGVKEGQWGRYLELTAPFVCHWLETVSTEYPVDYTHSVQRGFKAQGEWTGSVFIKTDPKTGNFIPVSEVHFNEKRLEEMTWEENH